MDALRYYMLRETVFGQDGNFSYDALVQRYNSDLANGLGNLTSRTLTMIEKYCAGAFPRATTNWLFPSHVARAGKNSAGSIAL